MSVFHNLVRGGGLPRNLQRRTSSTMITLCSQKSCWDELHRRQTPLQRAGGEAEG